jgi:uncharacterized DUF497 family protein
MKLKIIVHEAEERKGKNGRKNGVRVDFLHTEEGEVIRIISCRLAASQERKIYEED